jgi:hypothetical protein
MIDYYGENGIVDENKVKKAVIDAQKELNEAKNSEDRTRLAYEVMLRSLYLQNCPDFLG